MPGELRNGQSRYRQNQAGNPVIPVIKTKQDLIRALSLKELQFAGEYEVVNDAGLKAITDKAKALLRQQKKLHIVLIERA